MIINGMVLPAARELEPFQIGVDIIQTDGFMCI